LPFADDIRKIEIPKMEQPNPDNVVLAKKMIKKLMVERERETERKREREIETNENKQT